MELTQQQFELEHRPHNLKTYYPTTDVMQFQKMVDSGRFPQRITMFGPPGTGKTTMAHILAAHILGLNKEQTAALVGQKNNMSIPNFVEADFAQFPSAEYTSQIAEQIAAAISDGGMFGKVKYVFLLEEFTQLKSDTQKRLIKLISDHALDNIYVIITTNDIHKIESSFDDRMLNVQFYNPNEPNGIEYIQAIAKKEKITLSKDEARRIYHSSTGSYRSMTLNLWYYLSYGTVPTGSSETGDNEPVKRYLHCLNQTLEQVWRIELAAVESKTLVDYAQVDATIYSALIGTIETLAINKKSCRGIYEAISAYVLFVLRKTNAKYIELVIGYSLIAELEKLKTSYDGNPVYELLKMSEAVIRAKIEQRFYIQRNVE